ncbi:hypothetical protein [Nocardioides sp. SYSU DS0663]|uniref:hypothetical protein n=1 Tax=Nocardioides sp. SYSU DS0663 TaxID=3416445 RepID=UPI003F4B61E2
MTSEPIDERQFRAATQQAVDATATAYTRDAEIDVEDHLRREMARAGLALDDDAWVREVARAVRSGHHVDFTEPTEPGSLGGDNGGG